MEESKTRAERFVDYIFERSEKDTGFSATMRRADNPATEYQCWGILASFGVNLEKDNERLPCALIGSAICRSDYEKDGSNGIGAALAGAYEIIDIGHVDKAAEARLRRLLACASTAELCRVLRPVLRLVTEKSRNRLNFATLLRDLLYFSSPSQEAIKKRWAMDFYVSYPEKAQARNEG